MKKGSVKRVVCRCNGVKSAATFAIADRFLMLTTPFGTYKVAVGLQDPRKVAGRLFKKVCSEATSAADPLQSLDMPIGLRQTQMTGVVAAQPCCGSPAYAAAGEMPTRAASEPEPSPKLIA